MVDLICSERTFCQCFFSSETRKFIERCTFCTSSSGVIPTCPTATDRHSTCEKKKISIKYGNIKLSSIKIDQEKILKWKTHLLHLEFDGSFHLIDLADHRLLVGQQSREFTGFV